ncbi:MAG: 16S rRNA (cytidine(1402)-2'-O)-methyltransferase [candidate division Zixibacteria bacterium]|nr:16S rRNA (cytidine(1402)-2'-O)-methyltransferase [candidate division Zixibacteria bacterium]
MAKPEKYNKGILYLVATPIGNMGDITFRALEILADVDVIAAEDTRKTGVLLKHHGITARMESYHLANEFRKKDKLISMLIEGKSVAVVSDAGTPGISDPAYSLVSSAVNSEIKIVPVPGANSAIAALISSGLPTDKFYFGGFPPRKSGQRKRFFEEIADRTETSIFFESPYRLMKTISAMREVFGDTRRAAVCRELTKKFEEIIRGTLAEFDNGDKELKIKGEFVIVVEGNQGE